MPRKVNNFKMFEASLDGDTGLSQEYLDDVKQRGESESMERMAQGYAPHQIPALLPRLMQIQGAMFNPRTKDVTWIDEEKKERLEALVERIIRTEFASVIENLNVDLDLKLIDDKQELEDAADEMQDQGQEPEMEEEEEKEEEEQEEEDQEEQEEEQEEEEGEELGSDLLKEIEKRKLINNITQGSAKNTHGIIALYKADFDQIDPRLYDIMEKLIKSQETMEWDPNNPLNNMPAQGKANAIKGGMNGFADVDFGDDEETDDGRDYDPNDLDLGNEEEEKSQAEQYADKKPKLIARAVDVVVLLHESVKAIYEMIAASGIVDDEEMARAVLDYTDSIADEFEDLKYGVYIRRDLISFISQSEKLADIDNGFEFVWMKMVDMPAVQFVKLFKSILIEDYHNDVIDADVYHYHDDVDVTFRGTPRKIIDDIVDLIIEEERIYQEQIAKWEEQKREYDEWEKDNEKYEDWKKQGGQEQEEEDEEDEIEKLIRQSQKPKAEPQPEEEEESGEEDFSNMSKRDIQAEIDRIIDEEDMSDPNVIARLDKLSALV